MSGVGEEALPASTALNEHLAVDEWQVEQIRRTLEESATAPASEFVEHGSVTVWLESWGSENEQDPPRAPGEASEARKSAMNQTKSAQ